jgi:hypothetical protein
MLKAVEGYWEFSSETNRDAVSWYPQTRAPPLGHRPFSISVVNSFEGNFVWRHLYSRTNFKLNRAAALAEWRQLLSA